MPSLQISPGVVGTLNSTEIAATQAQSNLLGGAAQNVFASNKFVCFAAFDGMQNNFAEQA